MEFIYENPTKLFFGEMALQNHGSSLAELGRKALVLIGGGSVYKNGSYDDLIAVLDQCGLDWIVCDGVSGNPRLSHAEEAVELARIEKVDCVIALGGGSVIDEAKAISAGYYYDGDLWDFYAKKTVPTKALPLATVLTLPATASEMNGFSVLTHDETKEKVAIRAVPLFNPIMSFCDPRYTTTLSLKQTGFAAADIISHATEGYFTTSQSTLNPQDSLIEGLVGSVVESMALIRQEPTSISARASLMWSATLAWNGAFQCGIPEMSLPCHALEMPLSGIYDIAHGAGLSILTPSWMRAVSDMHGDRIIRFGKRCLGVDGDIETVAEAMEQLYKKIGAPLKLSELGVVDVDFDRLVEEAFAAFATRGIGSYDRDRIRTIYESIV